MIKQLPKVIYKRGQYYVMSKVSSSCKKSGENTSTPAVKKRSNIKPTATAYLQVFGSGGGDTSPSVFLFADSQRYVTFKWRRNGYQTAKLAMHTDDFLQRICTQS